MISSAVVIPETTTEQSQSPNLKRKFSPPPERDGKRLRVDTESTANNDSNGSAVKSAEPASAVSIPSRTSPQDRRRSSAVGVEEKKRNQRLFGTLLGTLSQATTSAKPAHRKRDEIEARQRERLKRQNEELEEERNRHRERIHEKRLRDQRTWEEEGLQIKHRNMRAMAGFLMTKTEPRLHFLPWELREVEEETIAKQKKDVEEQIRRDLGEERGESVRQPVKPRNGDTEVDHDGPVDEGLEGETTNGNNELQQDDVLVQEHEQRQGQEITPMTNDETDPTRTSKEERESIDRQNGQEDGQKEDDHHGEELVEGQEDDVIY